MSAGQSRPVTRRTFLETAAKTGLAAGVFAGAPGVLTASARAAGPRAGMNILPYWFGKWHLSKRTLQGTDGLNTNSVGIA